MPKTWVLVVMGILLIVSFIFNLAFHGELQGYRQKQTNESGTASPLSDSTLGSPTKMAIAVPRFLSLPFPSTAKYKVACGWDFDPETPESTMEVKNWGIDFQLPPGTNILAPADGLAIASYHQYCPGVIKGEPQPAGLGMLIQIFHPSARLYTQCAYLSRIEPGIPYLKPQKVEKDDRPPSWIPRALMGYLPQDFNLEEYTPDHVRNWGSGKSTRPVEVKRGQVIGKVADGKIYAYGGNETKATLHFEVFTRGPESLEKGIRLDPYGIYSDAHWYGENSLYVKNQEHNLWLADKDGKLLCADQ